MLMKHKKGQPYNDEVRRILTKMVIEEGKSVLSSSKTLDISYSTAQKIINEYKKTGSYERVAKPRNVNRGKIRNKAELEEFILNNPDLSQKELAAKYKEDYGISVSQPIMHKYIRSFNITYKKKLKNTKKHVKNKKNSFWKRIQES